MDNSSYIKMVLKSNRQLAIAVDKGIDAFIQGGQKKYSSNPIRCGEIVMVHILWAHKLSE
ncbi:Uncharacterised protein [Salmonella enterica subsp. salamae]|uniref:Uncharacterized protein n=1 Tax=Salmonella enterica subsp. salamae TaxID=59202 RepID=A0A6D2GDT4_SALER|nr:Uncharacterised protein [Salmonella enterica subsp. salamae]